jgi:hypothetical protein
MNETQRDSGTLNTRNFLCIKIRVRVVSFHGQEKGKHGVRTRGSRHVVNSLPQVFPKNLRLIHVGRSNSSRLISFIHQCHHIVVAAYNKSG